MVSENLVKLRPRSIKVGESPTLDTVALFSIAVLATVTCHDVFYELEEMDGDIFALSLPFEPKDELGSAFWEQREYTCQNHLHLSSQSVESRALRLCGSPQTTESERLHQREGGRLMGLPSLDAMAGSHFFLLWSAMSPLSPHIAVRGLRHAGIYRHDGKLPLGIFELRPPGIFELRRSRGVVLRLCAAEQNRLPCCAARHFLFLSARHGVLLWELPTNVAYSNLT